MSRRIDIELTSALPDGSWTWRAAGARNPRGTVDGALLPASAGVGDELKVEVEQMLEGIEVLSVVKGRDKAERNDLLELLPDDTPFEAVIETRAKRDRGERSGRRDRDDDGRRGRGKPGARRGDKRADGRGGGPGDGRDDTRGGRGDGGERTRARDGATGRERTGGERRERGERGERGDRPRRPHFEAPPEVPQRPKPKRLRPGNTRRKELLATVAEEQRQIAELALQGMAAVRARVKEENAKLQAAGKPEMPEASVLKMAESLLPKLRVADWLDRAEAAQRQLKQLDLRDLRSVVAASADSIVARDESTRELAEQLKAALVTKQAEEMAHWLEDVEAALSVGRVIRALRLSSQPPKAGVMFPPQLARRLGDAATASLLPDDSAERWSAVLEAAAFSPVRALVQPTTPPTTITDDLKKTVLRLGPLLPQVAALLGVEVPPNAKRPKPLRPTSRKDVKKERAERKDDRTDGRTGGRRDGRSDGRGRSKRGDGARPPKDRPKGMRDVATVMKAAEEEAAAKAQAEAEAEAAATAQAETDAAETPAEPAAMSDATPPESTQSSEEPAAPDETPAEPAAMSDATPPESAHSSDEPAAAPETA